LTVDG